MNESTSVAHAEPARWFLFGAALVAFGGSLWAAVLGTRCGTCGEARRLVAEIPLGWAGVVFYGTLATAIVWPGVNRWTRAAFYAAAGVHVVLMGYLASQQIICSPCILTGMAAVIGAVMCGAMQPRALPRAVATFGVAMVLASVGILVARQMPRHTTAVPVIADVLPIAKGHVRMTVYERPGCRYCLIFEEDFVPRLVAAFGDALEIERRDAEVDMESPTIYLEGKGHDLFSGLPVYETLEESIRKVRMD